MWTFCTSSYTIHIFGDPVCYTELVMYYCETNHLENYWRKTKMFNHLSLILLKFQAHKNIDVSNAQASVGRLKIWWLVGNESSFTYTSGGWFWLQAEDYLNIWPGVVTRASPHNLGFLTTCWLGSIDKSPGWERKQGGDWEIPFLFKL